MLASKQKFLSVVLVQVKKHIALMGCCLGMSCFCLFALLSFLNFLDSSDLAMLKMGVQWYLIKRVWSYYLFFFF